MKIYIWDNDGDTEFNTHDLLDFDGRYSSGQHSGGIVVIADDLNEAIQFATDGIGLKSDAARDYLKKSATEKELEKGLKYYGDGAC